MNLHMNFIKNNSIILITNDKFFNESFFNIYRRWYQLYNIYMIYNLIYYHYFTSNIIFNFENLKNKIRIYCKNYAIIIILKFFIIL